MADFAVTARVPAWQHGACEGPQLRACSSLQEMIAAQKVALWSPQAVAKPHRRDVDRLSQWLQAGRGSHAMLAQDLNQ